jgi:hypothetical protein
MLYTRRGTAVPCPWRYNFVPYLSGNRYRQTLVNNSVEARVFLRKQLNVPVSVGESRENSDYY